MDSKMSATPVPRPSQAGGAGAGPGTPAEGPTSCRECRRRRVQCDGTMPVCAVCTKYRRHCLYDKHSRTRLTRKQLTILEERLEKAESLLKSHFSEAQLAEMMNGATATMAPATSAAPPCPKCSQYNASSAPSHNLLAVADNAPSATASQPDDPSQQDDAALKAAAGSYELAPSVAGDFEWSEQEASWSTSTYGTGAGAGGSDSSQDIMDGMASLSLGERRGYLGAVSGAALLRQILSARKDGQQSETGTHPQHLESIFQQHPDQSQWFRTQSMLTKVAVENLIDGFFNFYHLTFPIVHEPTFRAQYAGTLPRPDKEKWNTLANILASLGSFVTSNCSDATDLPIFQAAQRSLFADNLESGNLTLVQSFALCATYLQKRNKPNSGYNYGGLAVRLGIGLGLHKEFEVGTLSPLMMEIRRRAWWCLCVLDVGATITYGRPLNWPQAGVEAALPRNIHEEGLVSDAANYPAEVDGTTLFTYLRVQASYHLDTMAIYNRLITGPFPTASELIGLDDKDVGGWLASIPAYYAPYPPAGSKYALGIGITQWRYRNLRIVMYRPFLVRWALSASPYDRQASSSTESQAVFRCLDAAKESITSIEEYWFSRTHSRLAAWYVLYFLFHATLIPLHCLRHNPQHSLAADWGAQIRSSMGVMNAMTELSPNSSKCRDVCLELCWQHLQEGRTDIFGDTAAFMPNLADGQAASMMDGYDAWCQMMSSTDTAVPMYQWPNVDDEALNFFY